MRLQNKNKIRPNEVNFVNVWHFLFISKLRNSWVSDDYFSKKEKVSIPLLDVYLRKSNRIIENKQVFCIDVANVLISEDYQNKGYFIKFIKELQRYEYPIFIESVVNPILKKSLIDNKHGLDFKLIYDSDFTSNFYWEI